jgi:hypothetical protein
MRLTLTANDLERIRRVVAGEEWPMMTNGVEALLLRAVDHIAVRQDYLLYLCKSMGLSQTHNWDGLQIWIDDQVARGLLPRKPE